MKKLQILKLSPDFRYLQKLALKLFGEKHQCDFDCYYSLEITQRKLGDFKAALQSLQCALDIAIKLFGEEH